MRITSAAALLAFGLLAIGCGDQSGKQAADATPPASNTPVPLVQKIVQPVTDGLAKAAGTTTEQLEAAKKDIAKYEAQVRGYQSQLADLTTKKTAAEKALADINAKAQAQVAPIQSQLDELNKQIKALEAVKVGASPVKYPVARAGFDVGGLLNKGSDTVASLKTKADGYQKQIDDILARAKAAGLPYVEQIASYTDSIKTVTGSLTKAQGLLSSAQQNLGALTGDPAK